MKGHSSTFQLFNLLTFQPFNRFSRTLLSPIFASFAAKNGFGKGPPPSDGRCDFPVAPRWMERGREAGGGNYAPRFADIERRAGSGWTVGARAARPRFPFHFPPAGRHRPSSSFLRPSYLRPKGAPSFPWADWDGAGLASTLREGAERVDAPSRHPVGSFPVMKRRFQRPNVHSSFPLKGAVSFSLHPKNHEVHHG